MKPIVKLIMMFFLASTIGCKKEPFTGKVEIFSVEDITHNSMVIKAGIAGVGEGVGLQVNGVCFDKTKVPVAERDHFEGVNPPGTVESFITGISGLDPETRYILRAYYETNVGIVYSDTLMVKTKPVEFLTDVRDGKRYEIKAYGARYWMLRNLDYITPGSMVFENKESNSVLFGRLYPYQEAVSVCPSGWRLPSDDDWKEFEKYIGVAIEDLNKTAQRGSPFGGMMKEPGMRLWESSNALKSSNHSGFTIVPSGWYNSLSGGFAYPHVCAQFWTESPDKKTSYTRIFYSHSDEISRLNMNVDNYQLSIRCVK